ncbi:serine/threonine protein kinase [Aerosakkonema sp. BLCC-F183]|uniref:serine/threonine protein kinase n=1 Tax=Aerosakkonema sp. BLCC-F183 TaxID=3342834 RepID=UPI0035B7ACA8
MTWTKGQQLQNGNYTIKSELGRGRYGITYLAKDNKNGEDVVIKTLNYEELDIQIKTNQITPEERIKLETRFLDEADKLRRYKHPHIVKVKKTFKEGDRGCIVMEYIPGDTLNRLVKRVLPEKEALRYIQQIGDALREVHKHDDLHRDVKPDNIMIRAGKYDAVLIDFELVRGFDHPLSRQVTEIGFAALELYSPQKDKGAYTDVYALAATLYAVLTGEKPPDAREIRDNKAQLIPPKQLNPLISERVNQAILAGMQLEAKNRPATVDEWLKLLGLKRGIPISVPNFEPTVLGSWANVVIAITGIVTTFILLKNEFAKPPVNPSPPPPPASTR